MTRTAPRTDPSVQCYRTGLLPRVLRAVQPFHIATYIEELQAPADANQKPLVAPSVKQHLAALRMLFDWLVVGQIVPSNPATSVRGPKHSVKKGKTPVLGANEARQLLDSIDTTTPAGLRDRALIALMTYTFTRVGAAVKMRIEDIFVQGRRTWPGSMRRAASCTTCPATTRSTRISKGI